MNILEIVSEYYKNYKHEKGVIGESVGKKPIYYFAIHKSDYPVIIAQFAIHAREYITSYLALKLMEDFSSNGKFGKIYFIPLTNPDGVEIALFNQPLYKANGRGVDLNVNFDARWGTGRKNLFYPAPQNYVGKYPFSEPETIALKDFTLTKKPNLTLSYHSKGKEVYWEFFQKQPERMRDKLIAERVAEITGYELKLTPFSAGGYKDWCIDKLKIPSLTIEVGSDELSHPIGVESLDEIYLENKGVLTALTEMLQWK